jgi:hypothetical protein
MRFSSLWYKRTPGYKINLEWISWIHARDLKRPVTGYNAPFLASMPKLDIHKLQAISLLVLTKSSSVLCQTNPMILLLLLTQKFYESCQLSKERASSIE